MTMISICSICGRPATTTCPLCGRLVCVLDSDPVTRVCRICASGRTGGKVKKLN